MTVQPAASTLPDKTSRTLLALQNVHTNILGSHILQGVAFDVTEGETTVLLGRNGAGKTTTLRTIMGILPTARGSITLDGRELWGKGSRYIARQGVGFVPEDRDVFAVWALLRFTRVGLIVRAGVENGMSVSGAPGEPPPPGPESAPIGTAGRG